MTETVIDFGRTLTTDTYVAAFNESGPSDVDVTDVE